MDIAVTIVMMIPVILAVALIINVIRKNLTEREAGDPVNITGVVPAVIVLVVAVMIIGSMGAAIAPYSFDEDSGELTIKENVEEKSTQPWDSYASDVKSLVIQDGVESIGAGAFDSLTALEYLSIPDSVTTIGSSAFGATLKDYQDQTITDIPDGEFVGGSGTLYYCDPSIYTYSTDGKSVTGLTTEAAAAVNLVIPSKHSGATVTGIDGSAFTGNTTATLVAFLPESSITLGQAAFQNCTGITSLTLSGGVSTIGYSTFQGCTGITEIDIEGVSSLRPRAFQGCNALESIAIPASLTSVSSNAFNGCTGATGVSFASGFAPSTFDAAWAPSWTFYDSDGTTVLDKTVASNLAGYTFEGTYSSLVKQAPVLLGSPEDTEEQELVQPVEEIEDTEMLVPEQSETKTAEALSVEEKELQTFEMDATEQELASA